MSASIDFEAKWTELTDSIKRQMTSRGYRAANELRNASLLVLRGQRSGRVYRVPNTKQRYTASAPGEPPANRTGIFRLNWTPNTHVETRGKTHVVVSAVESKVRTDNGKYLLGEILEKGTKRIAPRPHHDRIREKALPAIKKIYEEPYV